MCVCVCVVGALAVSVCSMRACVGSGVAVCVVGDVGGYLWLHALYTL